MACRILSTFICPYDFESGKSYSISNYGEVYKVSVYNPNKKNFLKNISAISCGNFHTVCLDMDGNIFTFGKNINGRLGRTWNLSSLLYLIMNLFRGKFNFFSVYNIPSIKQISCGTDFTICVSEDGNLYSFGGNGCGQLGHGNLTSYNYPRKVEKVKDVDFVVCGNQFSICKTFYNEIFAFGFNFFGQLGTGDAVTKISPVKCENWPDDIVDIKCGHNFTLVLTLSQEVYSCGTNTYFQLGRKTFNTWKDLSLKKIPDLDGIIRIECGVSHSMCIDVQNDLYIFGCNSNGEHGLGDTEFKKKLTKHPFLSNIIDISSNGFSTFVKTSSNEIFAFGAKDSRNARFAQLTPIQVFQGKEDIWSSNFNISRAKSAKK